MTDRATEIDHVVTFWREAGPDRWFSKDDAFDGRCRDHLLHLHLEAAGRLHDDWLETPEGALALLILLDQCPRNAFRGTAHMFATDTLAVHLADRAVALGHDRAIDPELRLFLYLPFEHAENLADQDRSVELQRDLDPEIQRYAHEHREIIQRFGRFPHRNAILLRTTTPEEQAYLDGGGFAG